MKKERILYLDILKMISLLFMIFIHFTNIVCGFSFISDKINIDLLYNINSYIYIITPTVFMFCMGVSVYLKKDNDYKYFLKRGVGLLFLGLILNILRGVIPYFIMGIISNKEYIAEAWYWLWGSDILYFAGLFFIILSILKKYKLPDYILLIVSSLLFIISNFIPHGLASNYTLSMIFGNIFYVDADSYFPIMSWMIVPVLGYFYQKYYTIFKNKNAYVGFVGLISLIIFIVSLGLLNYAGLFKVRYLLWGEDLFIFDLPTFILTITLDFVYISLIYFISKLIKSKNIINLCTKLSSNLTNIYCIHWCVLFYMALINIYCVNYLINSYFIYLDLYVFVVIISVLICNIISHIKKRK